jgi:hypothetical protein
MLFSEVKGGKINGVSHHSLIFLPTHHLSNIISSMFYRFKYYSKRINGG